VSPPAVPAMHELQAPAHWRALDFISDLHLQESDSATFEAWRRFMQGTSADAVFILGDLFEVWVGDDDAQAPGFACECAAVLRDAARARPVFFLHGNRDFLVGDALMASTGVGLLADPTVLLFAGRRWLLSHGDMLCLDDEGYLRFREEVRQPAWQRKFLAQPLAQRKAIARGLRERSEAAQRGSAVYSDVDAAATLAWVDRARADVMIHGHTHRPADHELGAGRTRVVLSDWDAGASPPRLQVLRVDGGGWRREPLS
jgi:UDP-2,3-diacylglucosamine hydrolase